MASLVLRIAGSAIGPSLFGTGFVGATNHRHGNRSAIGTLIGVEIDNLIVAGTHQERLSAPQGSARWT